MRNYECDNCRYFTRNYETGKAGTVAQCRRNAPAPLDFNTANPGPESTVLGPDVLPVIWPYVHPNDWCGEWAARMVDNL